MELKQFIKTVLADITDAVAESQQELHNGAVINPKLQFSHIDMTRDNIYTIKFDVALSVSQESSHKKEGNIGIRVISADLGHTSHQERTDITRITFNVPVQLPKPPETSE